MHMMLTLSPRDPSLIRTEFLGRRGVLIRGGLLYRIMLQDDMCLSYMRWDGKMVS